jgi:ABC-type branched-subunit amino acid transport system substrate-binding protein
LKLPLQNPTNFYFMHAATDSAAPICSIADQAKVLLIAEYKSYISGSFKFTLLGLSGEHTVYKK